MAKRKGGARQPLGYRRFATAAEAIRFAVEDFPPCARSAPGCRSATTGSTVDDIQRLYEAANIR